MKPLHQRFCLKYLTKYILHRRCFSSVLASSSTSKLKIKEKEDPLVHKIYPCVVLYKSNQTDFTDPKTNVDFNIRDMLDSTQGPKVPKRGRKLSDTDKFFMTYLGEVPSMAQCPDYYPERRMTALYNQVRVRMYTWSMILFFVFAFLTIQYLKWEKGERNKALERRRAEYWSELNQIDQSLSK